MTRLSTSHRVVGDASVAGALTTTSRRLLAMPLWLR